MAQSLAVALANTGSHAAFPPLEESRGAAVAGRDWGTHAHQQLWDGKSPIVAWTSLIKGPQTHTQQKGRETLQNTERSV